MNPNNLMDMYNQMCGNPIQFLSKRFNIPQDININDPNAILQHLLNSGQVSQQQVNYAMGMRNNPIVQQIIGKK